MVKKQSIQITRQNYDPNYNYYQADLRRFLQEELGGQGSYTRISGDKTSRHKYTCPELIVLIEKKLKVERKKPKNKVKDDDASRH